MNYKYVTKGSRFQFRGSLKTFAAFIMYVLDFPFDIEIKCICMR